MASIGQVHVSFVTDLNCRRACLGGQGLVQQKLTGTGTAFLVGGGTVLMKSLARGEKIIADEDSVS